MLMKRPSVETIPAVTLGDYNEYQNQRHRERRTLATMTPGKRLLAKAAIGIGIGLLPFGMYARYDIAPERARLAQTQPEIIDIYPAHDIDYASSAVVDMVGLGNLSAVPTATNLESYAALGNVMAVKYDNRGIDTTVIAQAIESKVHKDHLKSVTLSGHSMGGDVALQVAKYIYEKTDIPLDAVILDCTPPTLDTVRPEEREKGQLMEKWLPYIPGGDVSRTIRFTVEMGARQDRYISSGTNWYDVLDATAFKETAEEVYKDKISNRDAASNGLIKSQFSVISSSEALDNLHSLGETVEGKTPPAIIYMRPAVGTNDSVVDVDRAQQLISDEVGIFSGRLLVVDMENTGHANPNQRPTEYNAAITEDIVPFMERRNINVRKIIIAKSVLEGLGILGEDE